VAVLAGLQADRRSSTARRFMTDGDARDAGPHHHGIFNGRARWKLFRRLSSRRRGDGLRVLSVAGLVTVVWTGVLGGKLMFEHAAGFPRS